MLALSAKENWRLTLVIAILHSWLLLSGNVKTSLLIDHLTCSSFKDCCLHFFPLSAVVSCMYFQFLPESGFLLPVVPHNWSTICVAWSHLHQKFWQCSPWITSSAYMSCLTPITVCSKWYLWVKMVTMKVQTLYVLTAVPLFLMFHNLWSSEISYRSGDFCWSWSIERLVLNLQLRATGLKQHRVSTFQLPIIYLRMVLLLLVWLMHGTQFEVQSF